MRLRNIAFVLALLASTMLAWLPASQAHAATTSGVLILSTTVSGGAYSLEAQAATALGIPVTVVSPTQWAAMTTGQFASYQAIVLGDPTCSASDYPLQAAEANTATWGPAVTGNTVIIGTDPVYHATYGYNSAGAHNVINQFIKFATSNTPGLTGAYIDLSCDYISAYTPTPVKVLDALHVNGFQAIGNLPCFGRVHIVASDPSLGALKDSDLSDWECSAHEAFTSWPSDFKVLAIALDGPKTYTAADGTSGTPYIVARGAGLTFVTDIHLSPLTASGTTGGTQTLTATVHQTDSSGTVTPMSGAQVTFKVSSGPDAGQTGTSNTDSSGNAPFMLTNNGTAGVDQVVASFVNASGVTETSDIAQVTWTAPADVAPAVNAGPDISMNEGGAVSQSGSFTDADSTSWTATVDFGDGMGSQPLILNADKTFNLSYTYAAPGSYTITVKVTDNQGLTGTSVVKVVVTNIPPTTSSIPATATINEGSSVTINVTGVTDPGSYDTAQGFHYSFDCNNTASNLATSYASAGTTSSTTCAYDDGPSTQTILERIWDASGGYSDYSNVVTVNNVPPTAVFSSSATSVNEGSSVSLSLTSPSDPSKADTAAGFHYAFDCAGGSSLPTSYAAATNTTGQANCTFPDEGAYTVVGRIFDRDSGYTDYTASVTVNDVAPQASVSSPTYDQLIQVATAGGTAPVTVAAPFTDAGTADAHSCTVQWDTSLSAVAGSVTETVGSGSGTCSALSNLSPGVYLITVKVQESDNSSGPVGTATTEIIVYDPTSGFVTGGGWINSPAGAMPSNPSLMGKANFGFVSKYQKGSSVPTGETEFQFQVGNLDFHSNTYTVLTISGNQAQYRGSGTINGANDSLGNPYKFILTARDGDMTGGTNPDGFRMKITDSSGNIVYDNLTGASDDLGNTQVIAGGDIKIHT